MAFCILHFTFYILSAFCLLAGCRPAAVPNTPKIDELPIAGTWEGRGEKTVWKLIFEKDGTISEMVLPKGLHIIVAEGGVEKNVSENLSVHYICGPCTWAYDADKNNLTASITLENFYLRNDGAEIHSTVTNEFAGPLLNDGKEWTAEWTRKTRYDLPLPEHISEGVALSFRKVGQ